MGRVARRRFAWWTVPVALVLWAVVFWTARLIEVRGAPAEAGYVRVRAVAAPSVLWGTLAAAIALVAFMAHLRRARGLSG